MKRSNVSPNTWTWRVGALGCQHKERVPSARSWRCKLYKEPCRCTRRACAKIGEEKKVIAAGKQDMVDKTASRARAQEVDRQIESMEANARIQSQLAGIYITKDTLQKTLDALTNTLAVLDTPLARQKYAGNHWVEGTVESVHAAWKALTGRDYSVLGEEERQCP